MSASRQTTGSAYPLACERDGASSAIVTLVAERADDHARLASCVRACAVFHDARFVLADAANWRARTDAGAPELAIVVLGPAPARRLLDRLDAAARSCALIVVADRDAVAALAASDCARSRALIPWDDFCPAALEVAYAALVRARVNESRLLGVVADQNRLSARLGPLTARMRASVVDVRARFNDLPRAGAADPSATLARDAVAALVEAEAEISSTLRAVDFALNAARAPDLNRLVERLVEEWAREEGLAVSALTGEGPLTLEVPANALETWLRALAEHWRRRRRSGDGLEFIVWDAGEIARIAVVFSRTPGADRESPRAFVSRLVEELRTLSAGCGARIEAPAPTPAATHREILTVALPKRRARRARVLARPAVFGLALADSDRD